MATCEQLVEAAMIDLIVDFPIYAQLIARIGYKIVSDKNHPACGWTDGKAIYINKALIEDFNENPERTGKDGKVFNMSIGKQELIFLMAHELMHLITLTFDRGVNVGIPYEGMTQKDIARHKLWNMATDYEINSLLHNNEDTSGSYAKRDPIGKMPEWVLYESKWRNTQAEQIYKELLEEQEEKESQGNAPTFDDSDTDNNGLGVSLDDHLPILDDTTRNEVIQKISDVFGSKTNGTGSSAIDRALEITFQPQPFNWKKALTKYIRGWMKDNYTWNKPNRSGISRGLILPSAGKTPKMHIGVAVDTSGSIYDTELHAMMNHLFTILQQFKDFKIDVWCCGSEVYPDTLRTYTASNKKDLINFEFQSDGGNDMRKNFEFVKNHYKGDKLDLLLVMTDGYDPVDGDTETTSVCPVVWMILDHPNFVPPSLMKNEVYPFVVERSKNG